MVDLHTHSSLSDGTLSPKELIALAKDKGLKAIALTDHDIIDGLSIARAEAKKLDIEFIDGIEFSADYKGTEIHILGYFIDTNNKRLLSFLKELDISREKRNKELLNRLNEIGLDIPYDFVKKISIDGVITKAHFAKAIAEKGYAKNIKDAFNIYLKKGKPAYITRELISYQTALDIIKEASGISSLAHPMQYNFSNSDLDICIKDLKEANLNAIECFYPTHTQKQANLLIELCEKYNLKKTAGSDFHGENRNVILGNIFLNDKIKYDILKDLKTLL